MQTMCYIIKCALSIVGFKQDWGWYFCLGKNSYPTEFYEKLIKGHLHLHLTITDDYLQI